MKVYIQTLGCKVNQYETQAIESMLANRGHTVSSDAENCDVYVINTCAVTAESGRKSRQAIRHAKSQNPSALLAACGCFSQISPEEVQKLGVSLIAGSSDRQRFIEDLETAYNSKCSLIHVDEAMKRREFEELPAGNLSGRTRAMLKIQDGCSNFCSYCIIPYARGPVRSLKLENAAAEAKRLSENGYQELIVTGIEIASYGKDLKDGSTLIDAICAISENAKNARIRLGSLEPRIITEEFCLRLSALPNLCPHFHLSLQSGCDATLARMHRKYDTARFYASVGLLRKCFPACGITADLIVGFPGETEEEFAQTLSFIKKCAFSSMHIFPYSSRPGTAAENFDCQINKSVKHERVLLASTEAAKMKADFLNSCIGTTQSVLFENEKNGRSFGHAKNYCEVSVLSTNLHNIVSNVLITGTENGILLGNIML